MKKQTVLPRQGEATARRLANGRRWAISTLLDRCPNDGLESDLDVHQHHLFRLAPPAFLLRSVK